MTDDQHDPAPTLDRDQQAFEEAETGMRTVTTSITLATLGQMAADRFGNLVKAVVDVGRGINLYPAQFGTPAFIEFDSMINIRPSQNNRSRSVDDPSARQAVTSVVDGLVRP